MSFDFDELKHKAGNMLEKGKEPVKLVCSNEKCGFVTEKKEESED